jgi:hypothetical protein
LASSKTSRETICCTQDLNGEYYTTFRGRTTIRCIIPSTAGWKLDAVQSGFSTRKGGLASGSSTDGIALSGFIYEFVINGPNGDNLYLVMETLGTSMSAMVTIGDNFSDRLTLYVAMAIAVHIAMGCGTS